MPLYAFEERVPVIHPSAYVHPDAVVIGDGTVVHTTREWPTLIGGDCVVGRPRRAGLRRL